jgi:hypothetical protein
MSMVINDHFDKKDIHHDHQDDKKFDLEGFNFIIFRNTIFTNGDLVKHQYEKLRYIL